MEKSDRPEAFGVFKPVGHVVVSFPSEEDMEGAADALSKAGFAGSDVVRYSPEQMRAQAEADIAKASPLASLGQEINLVKAHRELAEQGYSFLIVHAPEDSQNEAVVQAVGPFRPARAQKYGRLMIEELIDEPSETGQTFESPARGLDSQTRSGLEKDR